jgi:hypothetical protein
MPIGNEWVLDQLSASLLALRQGISVFIFLRTHPSDHSCSHVCWISILRESRHDGVVLGMKLIEAFVRNQFRPVARIGI